MGGINKNVLDNAMRGSLARFLCCRKALTQTRECVILATEPCNITEMGAIVCHIVAQHLPGAWISGSATAEHGCCTFTEHEDCYSDC